MPKLLGSAQISLAIFWYLPIPARYVQPLALPFT